MRAHHQSKPGSRREWLYVGLPENPLCWLLGHSPRARAMGEPKDERGVGYGQWELIDCRRCGRRFTPEHLLGPRESVYLADGRLDPAARERAEATAAARLANLARMGSREFCASVERRGTGWHTRQLVLHHETYWPTRDSCATRPMRGFGFQLHLGDEGSETPIDAHVKVGPFATYVTVAGLGGRLAGWLGRGHKRDLKLEVASLDGAEWDLNWKLWYDGESGNDEHHRCDSWRRPKLWPWSAGRVKSRQWMCLRDGHLNLNPATAFWGHKLYHREEIGPVRHALVTVGEFEGDEYIVDFQLERTSRHRDHGPGWARRSEPVRLGAEWECRPAGIPVRNHDWKGDTVLASGCQLKVWNAFEDEPVEDWLPYAVDEVIAQIKRDRRHYGYQPRRDRVS